MNNRQRPSQSLSLCLSVCLSVYYIRQAARTVIGLVCSTWYSVNIVCVFSY